MCVFLKNSIFLLSQETSCKNSFLLSHDPVPLLSVLKTWFFGSFLHKFYEAFGGSPYNETHHSLILHRLPLHHKAILHLKFISKVTVQCSNISNYVLQYIRHPLPEVIFSDEGNFYCICTGENRSCTQCCGTITIFYGSGPDF